MLHRGHYAFLLFCGLFSGAASLVYEVVWARQLTLFLGTTVHAHTVVLAASMVGLALGRRVLGSVTERLVDLAGRFHCLESQGPESGG